MPPWVYRQPTNLDLLAKYGEENCSRGWCLQNWGVDQNTLRPQKSAREYDGGTSVRFQTADRDVRELIRKLSLVFKDLYLDYLWPAKTWAPGGCGAVPDGEALSNLFLLRGSRAAIEKALDILGAKASVSAWIYNPTLGSYEYKGGVANEREKSHPAGRNAHRVF